MRVVTRTDVLAADVLVVGAGPTGLTLACDLARRGVAVRIVDRVPEFPHGSRGKGLSQRSLEVFDDLGVVDRLLTFGVTHLPHRKYRGAEIIAEDRSRSRPGGDGGCAVPGRADDPAVAGRTDAARAAGRARRRRRTGRRAG